MNMKTKEKDKKIYDVETLPLISPLRAHTLKIHELHVITATGKVFILRCFSWTKSNPQRSARNTPVC
jgi:hypothetical protein